MVSTKALKSWDEIQQFQHARWIFRGQESEAWDCKTALERCCNGHGVPPRRRADVERDLYREFRRAYHQYSSHVPAQEAIVEWMALMQHYGAPTRLLDFTYSIYVAAYFAVEKSSPDQDAAIWAVNCVWALKATMARLSSGGKKKKDFDRLPKKFLEPTESIVQPLFMQPPYVKVVCPINAFLLNERLRIKKGVFLIPGNIEATFMDNLLAMPGHKREENLIKIIIPAKECREMRKRLFDMNITRRSLFPGLEGYAQALGIYHPVFDLDDPLRWNPTDE